MKLKTIKYKSGYVYSGPEIHAPKWIKDATGKQLKEYMTAHIKEYPEYWRNTNPSKRKPTREDGYYASKSYAKTYTTSDTSDGSRAYRDPTTYTESKLDIFK